DQLHQHRGRGDGFGQRGQIERRLNRGRRSGFVEAQGAGSVTRQDPVASADLDRRSGKYSIGDRAVDYAPRVVESVGPHRGSAIVKGGAAHLRKIVRSTRRLGETVVGK